MAAGVVFEILLSIPSNYMLTLYSIVKQAKNKLGNPSTYLHPGLFSPRPGITRAMTIHSVMAPFSTAQLPALLKLARVSPLSSLAKSINSQLPPMPLGAARALAHVEALQVPQSQSRS